MFLMTSKTRGKITSSTLKSLNKSMGNIDGYEDFLKVLANSKSSMEDIQNAVNTLATEYLSQSSIIKLLEDGNKDLVISQLELMGVANADEIATVALNQAKAKALVNTFDFTTATDREIKSITK